MKTPTALVLFFCAGSATPEVTERPLLKFHGNVAFDEVVYRSTLDLPENARATPAEALALSAKLLGFLRRAGYDLATVRAKVEGEQISVEIDEGRLDKIIVLGEGLMETFRFKLELALPAGVFNRPILERQLRVLAERYRLRRYSYELVPVAVQESSGPQVEELESLPGLPGIHPGWPYELHILIATSPWSRGLSPEISTGSPEGLGVGGQYREQDFLVSDDRWELRARVAGALREHLDSNSSRAVLTRVFAQGRWFSPPVLTESLRPALTVRGDLLSLQRSDLRLDSFHQATFAASVDASVFRPRAMVALGVGIERRFLLSLVKAIGANPLIDETPRAQTRPYAEAIAEIVFNRASCAPTARTCWISRRAATPDRLPATRPSGCAVPISAGFPSAGTSCGGRPEGRCSWVGCCFRTRNRSAATCTVRSLHRTLRASWPARGSSSATRSGAMSSSWASSTISSSLVQSIARPTPSPWRPQARAGRRCICSWPTSSRWTSTSRWDGRPTAARTLPRASCCGRCSDVVHWDATSLTSPSWWLR